MLSLALLGAVGRPALSQTARKAKDTVVSVGPDSLVPTASIRPLLFDPDLVTKRPTPLAGVESEERPLATPVFFVKLSPAINSGRMRPQRKPLTLKIQRQMSAGRWVVPADAFHDSSLAKTDHQTPPSKSRP